MVDTKAIAAVIEATSGWAEAKEKYYIGSKRGPDKYFSAYTWIEACFQRWKVLEQEGLISSNLKVLDIGAGFGYFAIVGKAYTGSNHIEMADVPDPMFDVVTSLLGLSKYKLEVNAFIPMQLQNNSKRYDLITAYRIVFDKWAGFWGEEEYRFFLRDIFDSLLNEGGSVVLGFNDKREKGFMSWAGPLGARCISKHDVLLPYETVTRIRYNEAE